MRARGRARAAQRLTLSRIVVAVVGDSICAGSPLWDPDPAVRRKIDEPDERSQWLWWAMRANPELELRNFGVHGERTDQNPATGERQARDRHGR